jgi:tetratricopeptide (TPR) repeat protein
MAVAFGSQLLGDFMGAIEAMNLAIPILEQGDDWRLEIFALNGQGQGGVMAGIPGLSAAMGARILEVCDERGLVLPRAYGLALLGEEAFFQDGDLDEAEAHLRQAIELFTAIGDDVARNMFGLGVLASVLAVKGDLDAAERVAIEASLYGGPGWSATALIVLGGFVLTPKGELDRAEEVILTGLERVHGRSIEAWVRPALLMLGRIAARRQRWEEAAWLLGVAKPNLTPWAQHRRFWGEEGLVRDALGEERYEQITTRAGAEELDDVVARVLVQRKGR